MICILFFLAQIPISVDTNTILPNFSTARNQVRLHIYYSEKGQGQAALVQTGSVLTPFENEHQVWVLPAKGYAISSFLNDAAMVIEYEGPDGDINLAPLRKFEFYEYHKNHYVIPHLGDSGQWINSLISASDTPVQLEASIGGIYRETLSTESLTVHTWSIDEVNRGSGFLFLKNTTENPRFGNDAYWNGIFEFARIDGVLGSAAIAPVAYRDTPGHLKVFMPHVAKDVTNFWTGFSILNPNEAEAHIQAYGYGYDGALLDTVSFKIDGLRQNIQVVQDLFPKSDPTDLGWVQFESDIPILGIELFGSPTPARGYLAGFELPSEQQLARLLLFPAVGFDPDRVTGVSLLNPHNEVVSIELALCQDRLGGDKLVPLTTFTLPPHTKWSGLLDSLRAGTGIPHSEMRGLRVYASHPITGFALIADEGLTKLGGYLAIPGSEG